MKEILDELLAYDQATGVLIWKARPLSMFSSERLCNSWNIRRAGKVAGTVAHTRQSEKRLYVMVNGKRYGAARVAWCMVNGDIPEGMSIDHINGDTMDNRMCNLRLATRTENQWNRGRQSNNTSGFKGVTFHKHSGKWHAVIEFYGRVISLGYYRTPEEASVAYETKARELTGEFYHAHHARN